MFKKIQNYLLINHPLLWNTKAVPMAIMLVVFNIIFFLIGFATGELDFSDTEKNYFRHHEDITIFFGVLISIISFIIWLVYYLKNNAFKSFYPKNNSSLFKEWTIIFGVCLLMSSFILSFTFGTETRIKNYFSENEAKERCETLRKASLFIGFQYDEALYINKIVNDTLRSVPLDYVAFNNKKYSLKSLINKDVESFTFFDHKSDSLIKIKIKNWLVNQQKDSIKKVMSDFFNISNDHDLKSNIDTEKWLSLVYDFPNFESKKIVAKQEKDYYSNYDYDYEDSKTAVINSNYDEKIDTINQYIKIIGKEKYVFNKNYVPASALFYNYDIISKAYTDSDLKSELFIAVICFALGLSIVLFSFKISSGRNWLIALVSLGILNIILGILTAIFGTEYFYLISILVIFIGMFIYYSYINLQKKSKGISAIILNTLLWMFPFFIPLVYFLIFEFLKYKYDYYSYINNNIEYPAITFFKDNGENMLWFNIVFIILTMYFFSIKIKKWKGIAEN